MNALARELWLPPIAYRSAYFFGHAVGWWRGPCSSSILQSRRASFNQQRCRSAAPRLFRRPGSALRRFSAACRCRLLGGGSHPHTKNRMKPGGSGIRAVVAKDRHHRRALLTLVKGRFCAVRPDALFFAIGCDLLRLGGGARADPACRRYRDELHVDSRDGWIAYYFFDGLIKEIVLRQARARSRRFVAAVRTALKSHHGPSDNGSLDPG